MVAEELALHLQMFRDVLPQLGVLGTTAHDANKAQPQRVHSALEDPEHVEAVVDQVQFRYHAEGALAVWIDLPGQRECVGSCQVGIAGHDRQDKAPWAGDVLQHELPELQLDVLWLVAHGHPCDAREVNECQVDDLWGGDLQHDRGGRDDLLLAADPVRVPGDLLADVIEALEALARQVAELTPFTRARAGIGAQEPEHERPPRHDATTSRQEAAAHKALEERRLADALPADDRDLRQLGPELQVH
mmetsp:Transcript_104868/g.338158  ORF Transcript_104868/g.338158 Transcript_104868/m.338158 type:complete len:246 (+) Transcript_104868:298-1035(+)